MEDIEELGSRDTLLSFFALGNLALGDTDPQVRILALRTLWEYEDASLAPHFIELLKADKDADVRAATADALGRFVYAGELEEIPARKLREIEDLLIEVANGEDRSRVRRSALESLGYSSRSEVVPLIQAAFASPDKVWKASALFAMGRSNDESWHPQVLSMLTSNLPLLRGEAARAAGELEISEAVPHLLELLDDPDDTTRHASIWSLSQIGGEGVREALEKLYEETGDEQDLEILESALDNLDFNEGLPLMPLFDFSGQEQRELKDGAQAGGEEDFDLIENEDLDD